MYAYTFDSVSGGIILTDDDTKQFSKEPRPVYAREMDLLGMDHIWRYAKQNEVPYMWAESNVYTYRGLVVARVKGGNLYESPALEIVEREAEDNKGNIVTTEVLPKNTKLIPIDIEAMCKMNSEKLSVLEQISLKMIYNYYKRHQKLDCFHVAFSGGKDSIVLLELVKKALPKSGYMVVFGDTGMEFPDTYDVVDKIEQQCKEEGIAFYRAVSHMNPIESWRIFGPPSRVLRWCCTVHKSTPQTIKIREVLDKSDYVGADFVGVRGYESLTRSEYDYENFGKKQKGQYSQNPILDWSSAEIWLYIYIHKLLINETYKKGNSRAGCLFCPMGGGKGDFFQYASYAKEIDKYVEVIKEVNGRDKGNQEALQSYVTNGGWNARKNGRDLTINEQHYFEEEKNGILTINIVHPKTDWREWFKTIEDAHIYYRYEETDTGYRISVRLSEFKDKPVYKKRFKQVFKKAAHCVGCRACEANCRNNCIDFTHGLKITNCTHCGQCHEIEDGCLAYHSLRTPTGGGRKMGSINSFANHAPKNDWIMDFIEKGDSFWENNTLGPNQVNMFKRFLRDTGLIIDNQTSELYHILKTSGSEDPNVWGIILANFAYNPQCMWYIRNLDLGKVYDRNIVADMLISEGVSKNDATSIINAFKRFCETPLGKSIHFGVVSDKGKKIESIIRTKTSVRDGRVILYALYKFAEACDRYFQFTLTRLLDFRIESAGISPAQIFGLDRDEMETILNGLTANYPEFINATFTHDLDKISLTEDKTSRDILKLF